MNGNTEKMPCTVSAKIYCINILSDIFDIINIALYCMC